jgi:hypothetical protein
MVVKIMRFTAPGVFQKIIDGNQSLLAFFQNRLIFRGATLL